MNHYRLTLATALLVTGPLALAEGPVRQISVTGAADVRVQPDYVVLSMGVETKSLALVEAKEENDARIERVLSFLKASAIRPADIKTDYLAIVPVPHDYKSTVTAYYRVQRSVTATLRKVSDFESVLNGCVERGITNVHGIDFRTSDLKKHREKARELAIGAAREKAEKLAGGLGAEIGPPLTISDSSWGGVSSWAPNWWGQRDRGAYSQVSYTPGGAADEPSGPVALGEILVSASVRVSFALR